MHHDVPQPRWRSPLLHAASVVALLVEAVAYLVTGTLLSVVGDDPEGGGFLGGLAVAAVLLVLVTIPVLATLVSLVRAAGRPVDRPLTGLGGAGATAVVTLLISLVPAGFVLNNMVVTGVDGSLLEALGVVFVLAVLAIGGVPLLLVVRASRRR